LAHVSCFAPVSLALCSPPLRRKGGGLEPREHKRRGGVEAKGAEQKLFSMLTFKKIKH